MKLINKEIEAVIFDLDGTLIDSTSVWVKVDTSFFGRRNMEIPKNYVDEIAHIGLYDAAVFTKNKYHITDSIESIIEEWKELAKNEYLYNIPLKNNVIKFLKKLKDNNVKIALATASDKNLYVPCLKRLKIYGFFDYIADVDVVGAGKDDVKLYNHVANILNVKPEKTAVFEDIAINLKTAYENNYIAIGVYDEYSTKEEELKKKYSYKFIKDFKELL